MKVIKSFFKSIMSSVFPNKCISCGELIDEGKYICDVCEEKIERINLDNICLLCGLENEDCVCKYNVYRFDSLICIYKNTGIARNIYYKYKFGKKQQYVDFFAKEMILAVKLCYSDIPFDYICYVPSYKKLTYNHSGYLAQELSKNLNIRFAHNLLSCTKRTKKQHHSSIKERLTNPNGKYKCDYRINGARILLVDDIKTTGATIDECAKILRYAGAESVHCITALGTTNLN